MAEKVALYSSFSPKLPISTKKPSSSPVRYILCPKRTRVHHIRVHAQLGGGEGDVKQGEKKKFITKDQEPEEYWQTAGERKGENPMSTPIPYIIIFGMSTPFVILAVAFANGWIKTVSNRVSKYLSGLEERNRAARKETEPRMDDA
ncbi:hypothetical protein Vadar_024641 [Vaccinium darrowii]|uniref:Uncharacterized protein n=1 Tax=Vaccinium darrowii TaxID=229202 RepID=A0ACB7XUI1_9ERIC|nr:hypothetical protein Vadar_024641 [Vaccinium darrowii]